MVESLFQVFLNCILGLCTWLSRVVDAGEGSLLWFGTFQQYSSFENMYLVAVP